MRRRTMKRNGFTWYHYWSAIFFRFYNNEEICLLRRKRGTSRVKFLLAIPCLMNSYRLKFWYDVHRSIILCRLCTRYYIIFLLFVDFLYLSFEQQRETRLYILYMPQQSMYYEMISIFIVYHGTASQLIVRLNY